jgi:uncharacterized protein with von Willebrand factor type A (vWA) domain
MPQLTKGARELLEQMADLLGAIRQYARECDLADIKMFPLVVEQVLFDIDRTAAAVEDRVRHDLEPMLQSAEHQRRQRVTARSGGRLRGAGRRAAR